MQRDRIVDLGTDAALSKKCLERIAIWRPNHVLIPDVSRLGAGTRQSNAPSQPGALESRSVELRIALPPFGPLVEMAQFDREHRSLYLVDAEVTPDQGVVIFRMSSVHAQYAHALGQLCILGDAHTRIAKGAEILAREKRQATNLTHRSGADSIRTARPNRLGCIFDHWQAKFPRQLQQRRHVGALDR